MIAIGLIIGAGIIAGIAALVAAYWNKIVSFIKKAVEKIENKLGNNSKIYGVCTALKKLGNKFQNRIKNYRKDKEKDKWIETIVTYEENAVDIPEEYRNYAENVDEYDTTALLEQQLLEA